MIMIQKSSIQSLVELSLCCTVFLSKSDLDRKYQFPDHFISFAESLRIFHPIPLLP